jgi:hypothetical protein
MGGFPMNTLQKTRFRELAHGECAGAPILLTLWDRFDYSCFSRSQAFSNTAVLLLGCSALYML